MNRVSADQTTVSSVANPSIVLAECEGVSVRPDRFLLAYFRDEKNEDGEQIRFAVSTGPAPTAWTTLNGGRPVLTSEVGEGGARDPYLVRDPITGGFVLLATDLRVWPDDDWERAMRFGSRAILVWTSIDLSSWTGPRLVTVAPPQVGNTWAPKAVWSPERGCWMVVWASALFDDEDRTRRGHQRLLTAPTRDFTVFGPAEVYLDTGYDVLDAAFLRDGADWYRISAVFRPPLEGEREGTHVVVERGAGFDDPAYETVAVVGRGDLKRGEGPAVARAADGTTYALIDEFGLRSYQLFATDGPPSGSWHRVAGAALPDGARHGSLLPITELEAELLLAAEWPSSAPMDVTTR